MIWFLIGLIVFGLLAYWLVSRHQPKHFDRQVYKQRWQALAEHLKHEQTFALAVIEADKLLDQALKEARFKGSTMAERLVSAGQAFSNRDRVWTAHKLRNKLVHESGVKLNSNQTKTTLQDFKRALKDLGALA